MRAAPRNLRRSRARCLCGLRVSLHFTPDNRKLSCEEARHIHPRATVHRSSVLDALRSCGFSAGKAVR